MTEFAAVADEVECDQAGAVHVRGHEGVDFTRTTDDGVRKLLTTDRSPAPAAGPEALPSDPRATT